MKLLTCLMLSAGILSPAYLFAAPATEKAAPPQTQIAPAIKGVQKVTSVEGITEYRLANGLRVLLFPDASKPTLTTNIIYLVGSRHENYGETGMAHLLEHLLFKPSLNFGIKKGSKTPVEVLNSIGGQFNGTTWFDRTNYYAIFPANDANLTQMLKLEADRMVNAAIDQNDLWNPTTQKGEMTVVRNEFESGESNPLSVTTDRIQAVAYDWHNYGKSTIGARSDIEQVNIPRLKAFYQKYYQPDNAILMVAGRFDEAKVLKQIDDLFGKIPKPKRVLQATYTAEPTQDGERAVTVRRSGGTQYVGVGYHVAPSGHPDAVALNILGRILAESPGGRLHKALIETKLATKIEFDVVSNLEPGYRIFGALVAKDNDLDATQKAMLATLEGVQAQPITDAEVARAKQQIAKEIELATADTSQLTIALTESMAAGDWRLFFLQRDQLEKITTADVQTVALKYLKPSNHTIGRFIPTDTVDRAEIPATPDIHALVKDYKGHAVAAAGETFDASPANIDARTQRSTLANGMKLALLPKKTKGESVNIELQLHLGNEESLRGKASLGEAAANMLLRGTQRLSREELKDAFDQLKAQVQLTGSGEGVNVRVMVNRANLVATIDLLAEVLKQPAFPDKEFQEYQLAAVNAIEQRIPEPQPLALNALTRLVDATPAGHIRHVESLPEQLARVQRLKLDDVKSFYNQFYGAGQAGFAAVGDFDAAALKAQLEKLFGNWKSTQSYVRIPTTLKSIQADKQTLNTPDKANSVLLAVQPIAMKDSHPNYAALVMADYILGGGALHSRLADRIRQKEGLSYGVGSQLNIPAQDPAGFWLVYAISAPQNTAKVEAALREELQLAIDKGFTEEELAEAKKSWRQSEEVSRTQDGALAHTLTNYLQFGRTMSFDQELESKINKLALSQVNQVLRDYLHSSDISVIIAADLAKAGQTSTPTSK